MLSDKFICAGNEFCTFEKHVPAYYFRKMFSVDAPKAGKLTITALGFYRLWFNGKEITRGALSPYISNPDQIMYYDAYEVELQKNNVICVLTGNGMQNAMGGDIWDFDKAEFRSAPKFALSVMADGKTVLEADESFLIAPSPIIFDDLRAGEHYDARLKIPGATDRICDTNGWQNAIKAASPKGDKLLSRATPITVTRQLKPIKITAVDGGFIYDFGENAAGVLRLSINSAHSGQKITMTHGEVLLGGRLDLTNISFGEQTRKGCMQTNIYYCKGGAEEYIPSFTYAGFRYAFVEGITAEQATEQLLTYLVMNTELEDRAEFESSDMVLNKIYQNTRRTTLANFYHFPTDCPHREKNGWTGDANLSAEQIMLNYFAGEPLLAWLESVIRAQKPTGALPGIVPTGEWGYTECNGPAWEAAIVSLPYNIFRFDGNKEAIRLCRNSMLSMLEFFASRRNKDGLIEYGLADWCPAGKDTSDYDAPPVVVNTLICMDACQKVALLLSKIDENAGSEYALKEARAYRNAFRSSLIDDSMLVKGNCQTSQAMAIYYGIFDESEKTLAFEHLLNIIRAKNWHFGGVGVLGLRVLFRVLADNNEAELAYKMIVQDSFPSYGYQIMRGATSLYEDFQELAQNAFGEYHRKDGRPQLSLSHHFFGDVSAFMIEYLAGIKPNTDLSDPNCIEVSPHFIDGLDFVNASYSTKQGKISVKWKREGELIELRIQSEGLAVKPRLAYEYSFDKDKRCYIIRPTSKGCE